MLKRFGSDFECLEDRTLLAGNITATLFGGTLFVTGNATANDIRIEGAGGLGDVEVNVYKDGETLTVFGGTAEDSNTGTFSGVTNIVVNGGAGGDRLEARGLYIAGSLVMDGGTGIDDLYVNGGYKGDSIESVGISDVSNYGIGGSLILKGGKGDDFIGVYGASVECLFKVLGGAGDDDLDLHRNYIGGSAIVLGETGNDEICFEDNYVECNLLISGGKGYDTAYFGGSYNQVSVATANDSGSNFGSNWIGGKWVTFVEEELENCPFDR